jgi:hypothetical protein
LITAVASEYVLHCASDTKLLGDVLGVLESSVKDPDCYTCVYALRGLGNYSALGVVESSHLGGVMSALVKALEDTVFDEVQTEALNSLSKTINAIDHTVLAPTVKPLATQLFHLADNCANETVCSSALGLLAQLTDSLAQSDFSPMLHQHLVLLILMLNPRQPTIRSASRALLRRAAFLLGADASGNSAATEFGHVLGSEKWEEDRRADLDEIGGVLVPLMVEGHSSHIDAYLSQLTVYLHAKPNVVQLECAAQFAGIFLSYIGDKALSFETDDACSALLELLSNGNTAVKGRAARALGKIHKLEFGPSSAAVNLGQMDMPDGVDASQQANS